MPLAAVPPRPALNQSPNARILGLDPGSLVTGYAIVECVGTQSQYLASGSIRTRGESFPRRLEDIFSAVSNLVLEWQPQEIAIEKIFMHRNADSALKLGQARGAALAGTFVARATVFEYSPREVKLAVVGTGAAQKEQVQLMVKRLLRLTGAMGADAADALAIALCHAHTRRLSQLLDAAR
ncbi:MAG: crossover junction endodeoxyribonuclease RuvC [Candidatus Obscuribacterales bacterium]|nr:crossover junction endodeoxyribonuclease RuvC [Steroidobacteraceae bacterium]